MPDFDFDAFNHEYNDAAEESAERAPVVNIETETNIPQEDQSNHTGHVDEVDKW